MNLPNRITIFRLFLPIIFLPILMSEFAGAKLVALIIFILGAFSDWLDGHLARKYNMVSPFGRLMDPLADKIMVSAALISFVLIVPGIVKVWMVVVIISRDFIVTGLRLLALQSNYVISADRIGKHKTAWQMVAIISTLVLLSYQEFSQCVPENINDYIVTYFSVVLSVLYYVVVLLTALSGFIYLWRHRELYVKQI